MRASCDPDFTTTPKIEKGAGAESRKPLTRPADGMVLRRHLRVTTVILDPFIFPVPGAAPGMRAALPLYRRLGSLGSHQPVRNFVEAGIAPARPRSKRGGLLLADSTLSKNGNLGLARNRAWFPGLRNRCSSSKASGPSQELAGVGYRARFPGLKDRCSSAKASPAESAAAPIRTEFSRSSNGRYSKPAPTAYWGDQPDSNRLREGHGLSCCLYNMAAINLSIKS